MIRKILYLIIVLQVLSNYACKSEDDKILPNPLEVINDSKWNFTRVFSEAPVKIENEEIQDFLADLTSCEIDNALIFRSDNILIKDEGPEKCDQFDDQERICGTWQLDGLILKIALDNEDETNNLVIECLSLTEMSGILEGTYNTGTKLIPFIAEFVLRKK